MRKLRSKSGETLAEVLVAILVVAVSASLFLGMVAVSARINRQAVKADARFYKAMSLLECFEAEEGAVEQRSGSLRVEADSHTHLDVYKRQGGGPDPVRSLAQLRVCGRGNGVI